MVKYQSRISHRLQQYWLQPHPLASSVPKPYGSAHGHQYIDADNRLCRHVNRLITDNLIRLHLNILALFVIANK